MSEADQGNVWAVDMDLEKFFDTVNHSRLIRKLSTRIKDGRVISLITRMLKSGVSVDGKVQASEVGLMQGGPLSPLLANIYLDELDKELQKRGHRFARYADVLVILCRSKRAAQRTLTSVTRFLEGRMKLKVNDQKTTVSDITRGVKFLGHGFYKVKGGVMPTVHSKSKERLKNALREILSRNRKKSIEAVKETLRKKLRGWCEYFKLAKYEKWSKTMDEWIRRRIRQLLWKRWKRVRTRYRALRALGSSHEAAYMWANTRKYSEELLAHSEQPHLGYDAHQRLSESPRMVLARRNASRRVWGLNYGNRRKTPREGRLPGGTGGGVRGR